MILLDAIAKEEKNGIHNHLDEGLVDGQDAMDPGNSPGRQEQLDEAEKVIFHQGGGQPSLTVKDQLLVDQEVIEGGADSGSRCGD